MKSKTITKRQYEIKLSALKKQFKILGEIKYISGVELQHDESEPTTILIETVEEVESLEDENGPWH